VLHGRVNDVGRVRGQAEGIDDEADVQVAEARVVV
jgi:hypothetical protein